MQSELPDLDEVVSFVVDGGTSYGPVAMSEIITSVSSGERDSSVLVWWAGATDWIRFDSSDELMAIAGDVSSQMPAQPAPEVFEPVAQQPIAEPGPEVFEPVAEQPFEEPVAEVFEPVAQQPFEPSAELAQPAAQIQPTAEQPIEPVAEATSQPAPQAFEPSSLSPVHKPTPAAPAPEPEPEPTLVQTTDADGWSVLSEYSESTEAPAPEPAAQAPTPQPAHAAEPAPSADPFAAQQQAAIAAAAAMRESQPTQDPAGDEGFSFNLPTREANEPSDGPAKKAAITGLFSSGARDGDLGEAPVPSADALDAILVARASLESVGARIEALSSATKRSLTPEQIQSGVDDSGDPNAVSAALDVAGAPSHAAAPAEPVAASGSWTAVEAEAVPATDTHGVDMSSARAELNQRFNEMVAKSVEHQRRIEWITRVDELLLSACITAIADSGFVAADLNSRESAHRVMFEHNDDSRKVRLDLAPLETVSQLGRHVKFGLSWGRDTTDPDRAFEIVRQNTTDGLVPPGVLTCEADMATSSISVHVDLILAADDFVKDDYSVDRPSLDSSIAAALHALETHWHGLFDAA